MVVVLLSDLEGWGAGVWVAKGRGLGIPGGVGGIRGQQGLVFRVGWVSGRGGDAEKVINWSSG